MIRGILLAVAGLVLLAGAVQPAAAATINYEITFSAADFGPKPSAPDPSVVLGQFSLTLDPSQTVVTTAGIALNFLNVPLGSALAFSYDSAADFLTIGGLGGGVDNIDPAGKDFVLGILGLNSANPNLTFFMYGPYVSENGAVHVSAVPVSTTPIPAALPLFLAAIGGLGFAGWRRRKAAV